LESIPRKSCQWKQRVCASTSPLPGFEFLKQ
jgi:hypothetical protein